VECAATEEEGHYGDQGEKPKIFTAYVNRRVDPVAFGWVQHWCNCTSEQVEAYGYTGKGRATRVYIYMERITPQLSIVFAPRVPGGSAAKMAVDPLFARNGGTRE
jgi:hypothetical protein